MNVTEEFQKRQAEKPDPWTLAWWSAQFQEQLQATRGAKHAIHLALADNEDLGKQVKDLQNRVQTLEAASASLIRPNAVPTTHHLPSCHAET